MTFKFPVAKNSCDIPMDTTNTWKYVLVWDIVFYRLYQIQ